MKKIIATIIATILTAGTTSTTTNDLLQQPHTFTSVATYYCTDDDSYIIDDVDGNVYDAEFDLANGTQINVIYDNNNTLIRTDDDVISYTTIK